MWEQPAAQPTTREKRVILGKVIEISIFKIMENYHYKFGTKMYKQGGGGAIGLHLTGSVARVCMDLWGEGMRLLMEDNLVKVYLFERYVDDINWLLEAIGLGVRWSSERKSLVWNEEWEREDVASGVTRGSQDVGPPVSNVLFPYGLSFYINP